MSDWEVAATIPAADAGTLSDVLQLRIERTPTKTAYRQFDATAGRWQSLSWADVGHMVTSWQRALIGEGLRPGDRVGVLLRNSLEWVGYDQAALRLGLIVVPHHVTNAPSGLAYQLAHAGVRVLSPRPARNGTRSWPKWARCQRCSAW